MSQLKEGDNVTTNSSDFESVERCLDFRRDTANAVLGVKVGLDSVGIIASLTVIVIVCTLRNYKRFMYRLVIYLMAVNILQALFQILGLIPVQVIGEDLQVSIREGTGWISACQALGYLDLVTFWMENLIIVWIMLAMVWRLQHLQKGRYQDTQADMKQIQASRRWEVLGIITVLFSPFVVCCVPFIFDMYGLSGLWCWIKIVGRNGCTNTSLARDSLILTIFMSYGPLLIITIFALVSMIVILFLLCKMSKVSLVENTMQFHDNSNQVGIALIYPIIQAVFCVYLIGTRIHISVTLNNTKGDYTPTSAIWIIHAIADTSRILIPASAFLLHPYTWKSMHITLSQSHSTHPEISEYSENNLAEVSPVFSSNPEENDVHTPRSQAVYREYGNSAEAWTLF